MENIFDFVLHDYKHTSTNCLTQLCTYDCASMSKEVRWLLCCISIVKRMHDADRPCSWVDILRHLSDYDYFINLQITFQVVPDSIIGRHLPGALCIACYVGAVDVVNLLLTHGVDPNATDPTN